MSVFKAINRWKNLKIWKFENLKIRIVGTEQVNIEQVNIEKENIWITKYKPPFRGVGGRNIENLIICEFENLRIWTAKYVFMTS